MIACLLTAVISFFYFLHKHARTTNIYWGRVQSKFGFLFGFGLLVSGCLAFMQEIALGSISMMAISGIKTEKVALFVG